MVSIDLQIESFQRDIRLAQASVDDLLTKALARGFAIARSLDGPSCASTYRGCRPSQSADLQQLLSFFNQKKIR